VVGQAKIMTGYGYEVMEACLAPRCDKRVELMTHFWNYRNSTVTTGLMAEPIPIVIPGHHSRAAAADV